VIREHRRQAATHLLETYAHHISMEALCR